MPIDVVVGRDQEDMKKYGKEGTLFIGKHLVGKGEDAHLTTSFLLDALRPHIITLCGKRGSGKSYNLGVIVEELANLESSVKKNLCALMIDTQGIFWTMKSPNEQDIELLQEWGMEPKGFETQVYVPKGQVKTFRESGVEFDDSFSILPSQLTVEDWLSVFELSINDSMGVLLSRVIEGMKGEYTINEIISAVENEEGFGNDVKLSLQNRFLAAKSWGIFGDENMPKILDAGKISVLDVSLTPQIVRSLLVGLASRQILEERIKARRQEELSEIELRAATNVPMCWMIMDEAHNFIPDKGNPPSLSILNRIVKEGRQPGITLVLATQRPNKLSQTALSQSDLVISHRLTSKADIEALRSIMQTYVLYDIGQYLADLPKLKGVSLILDDNSERLYRMRVRPRQSWHAGASPTAVDES